MYIVDTGSWRTSRPVIREEDCVRCGICAMYCPVNCIHNGGDGPTEIDLTYCKGCGICRVECPKQAIDWVQE
jgi:pyruvate ferredoxin oxidoreductase delta subunit